MCGPRSKSRLREGGGRVGGEDGEKERRKGMEEREGREEKSLSTAK